MQETTSINTQQIINSKRIAFNTIIVYFRLFIVTVIGLVSTRLVLKMLGVGDYGLYNVVGGIIVILNVFCTAMSTTTRRYINVEMGKSGGNVNKVFNICIKLHVLISIIFFILAEIIGLYYIYNFLNVETSRISDCVYIYNISLITSCLSLINVPYQSTLNAHERFFDTALIDIITNLTRIVLIYLLYIRGGALLRLYAIVMCATTILSLLLYYLRCYSKCRSDVNNYKDNNLSKEILVFNNYTTLGAVSYMTRTQGANLVINFFFNTIINGAYAIAYQIESYLILLVSNLTVASAPQITQSYSAGDIRTSMNLVMKMNKLSILMMLLICFSVIIELPFLLEVWLGSVPDNVVLLSSLTIVSAFIRSLGEGIPPLIQASGKIKWFQLISSMFTLLDLPIAIVFFIFGFPPQTIIIVFCISSLANRVTNIYLLYRILKFDVPLFLRTSYLPVLKVLPFFVVYFIFYKRILLTTTTVAHVFGLLVSIAFASALTLFIGFDKYERKTVINMVKSKIKTI